VPVTAYQRPQTEEQLLAALEEIEGDGDGGLAGLGLDFGGQPDTVDGDGSTNGEPRDAIEAEEVPEVDSPLDSES
jgi:hypothetical protein